MAINSMQSKNVAAQPDRRSFLKRSLAILCGGAAVLLPGLTALTVIFDPLRRKAAAGTAIRIASLDSIPADGIPRRFSLLSAKTDAWNKFQNAPIGAIYLRRTSDNKLEALNVVCPHAGCSVDFSAEQSGFVCPCHNSHFNVDGSIASKKSPSPRGLDTLPVEVGTDGGVWITFQNFQAGRSEKVPVS